MRENMLENVIDSCKYVMENAKYVIINYDKLCVTDENSK